MGHRKNMAMLVITRGYIYIFHISILIIYPIYPIYSIYPIYPIYSYKFIYLFEIPKRRRRLTADPPRRQVGIQNGMTRPGHGQDLCSQKKGCSLWRGYSHCINPTGWGPQDSVQLPYKFLNSMVYGRYNELVNGAYHGL